MKVLTIFSQDDWDSEDDDFEEDLGEAEDGIASISFAPDGKRLAIWCEWFNNIERLLWWDLKRNRQTASLEVGGLSEHREHWAAPALSADHRFVARIGYDKAAQREIIQLVDRRAKKLAVWKLGWGDAVQESDGFQELLFTPSGRYLLAGAAAPVSGIHCWDVPALLGMPRARAKEFVPALAEPVWKFSSGIQGLAVSPEETVLAASLFDRGEVRWWDFSGGALGKLSARKRGSANAGSLAFSPDGKTLAVENGDQTTSLIALDRGKVIATLEHDHLGGKPVFLPSGGYLATFAYESVYFWTDKGKKHGVHDIGLGALFDVAFSPDAKLCAAAASTAIGVWEI